MKTDLSSSGGLRGAFDARRQKFNQRPLWQRAGAVLAVLVLAWAVHAKWVAMHAHVKKGGPVIPVAATPAREGDIPVYLDGLGNVAAYYTVSVHTRVDGQLMSVDFREGQYVKEGDLLMQIDPRPYQAALDQAKGQLAKDQALLADAKLDLDRYKPLLAENAIPQQQYDTQAATVGQYEGAVENDKASVEAAQVNLTYTRITSPINGRVGLRQIDPGNIVHAADVNPLLVITQLQPITVIFTLPEDSLPQIMQRVNRGEKLMVKAYNRDKTQELATGKLLTVDNQIDPTTGTSKLKAVFDNKDNALFPNQFVNVRLLLDTLHGQVIVPTVAIQDGVQGKTVYVVKADKSVAAEKVTVGVSEGTDSAVTGIKAGDQVVTDGAESLQPGSHVRIDAPAGGPPSASKPTTATAKSGR